MKSIVRPALLLALLFTSASFASETVSITWDHRSIDIGNNWVDEYYTCFAMESTVTKMLTTLGAREIKVNCAGGLPYSPFVFVHADFLAPTPSEAGVETASYQTVQFKGHESCNMTQGVLRQVLPAFSTKNEKGLSLCASPDDRYRIQVDVPYAARSD